jgi:FtsP/CotA-like multicopper oxidase with cupredoxin domain
MQIDKTGQIVQNQGLVSINSNNPTVRLVNGQLQPVLTMLPGQTELWRLTNAGADIFYDLHLDGYTFTVVAQDGYPAAVLTTATTLLLPPGKRYDVLVSASSHPGDAWLQTLPYSNGPGGDSYPAVNLLRLHVAGEASPTASTPPAAEAGWATSTAGTSLAAAPIAQSRTVTLSENAAGTVMYINGKQFDPNKSIFSTPAILGTVEQWTVLNTTGEVHPFHLHTDHFQVMSIAGVAQPYVGQQDTIPVPYEQNGTPGQVVIRIAFTDFTGRLMFHCHIAAHEDSGMMSFINVDQPPAGFDKRLMWNAGP